MTATKPLGYILKPFDKRDIRVALQLGFSRINTKEEQNTDSETIKKDATSSSTKTEATGSKIIGESKVILDTIKQIQQVAFTDITVLIQGETGSGKELIMEAIHAALPKDLIESVLFGHEKGSFTGATEKRQGKFELANEGTLFLDEIGELPLESQSKLLRCLQEKEIEKK